MNKKNLPNILTLARGVLTLAIIVIYAIGFQQLGWTKLYSGAGGWFWWSILDLLVLASLTDALDGWLARRWRVLSDWGKIFDPLMDKVLTIVMYLLLAPFVSVWLIAVFALLILREVVVDGMKNYLWTKGVVVAAHFWGKVKTAAQLLMLGCLILGLIYFTSSWWLLAANILAAVALVTAYYSGYLYVKKFINAWRFR